ncbi:MAG: 30S ribosomal protein S16, partial [Endomicrobiia bacterium]
GKKNQPQFRIVVIDSRKRIKGEPIEVIGYHNPSLHKTELKTELYEKWLKNGAQPSDTVKSIYKKFSAKQKIQSEIISAITSNS